MKQTITDSGNYLRSVEITECVNPRNLFQLKFTSKLRDAKDPEEEQVNFTAILSRDEVKHLSEFLKQIES